MGAVEPCMEEEITGVWKVPLVCRSRDMISPAVIKVQDIRLRIKTQPKRKCVCRGTLCQEEVSRRTFTVRQAEMKAMSRSQLEGLKTFFNIAKEKSTSINKEEDRIFWAIFSSSPVLKMYRIYLRGICMQLQQSSGYAHTTTH